MYNTSSAGLLSLHYHFTYTVEGFTGGTVIKTACHCRRHKKQGLISGSGRSPRKGNGNPLRYSCLENPMDRGAWQATVHRVTQSQTQLK